MSSGKEFRKNSLQQLELASDTMDLVIDHSAWVNLVFDAVEQERMLADLSELHELVAETFDTRRFPVEQREEAKAIR